MELSTCKSEIATAGSREMIADLVPNDVWNSAGIVFGRRPVLLIWMSVQRSGSLIMMSHLRLMRVFKAELLGAGGRVAKFLFRSLAKFQNFDEELAGDRMFLLLKYE